MANCVISQPFSHPSTLSSSVGKYIAMFVPVSCCKFESVPSLRVDGTSERTVLLLSEKESHSKWS